MIYRTDIHIERFTEEEIRRLIGGYPAGQAAHILAMHHLQGQRERTAAYQLLTDTLKELYPDGPMPVIGHHEHGQPFLENYPRLHFSQSHCKKVVAIAIDQDGPIGIDVECRRKVGENLIQRVCNKEEQHLIGRSADPELEFLRLWTRKEAYVKCLGTGIQDSLQEVERQAQEAGLIIESHLIPEADAYLSICREKTSDNGHQP